MLSGPPAIVWSNLDFLYPHVHHEAELVLLFLSHHNSNYNIQFLYSDFPLQVSEVLYEELRCC